MPQTKEERNKYAREYYHKHKSEINCKKRNKRGRFHKNLEVYNHIPEVINMYIKDRMSIRKISRYYHVGEKAIFNILIDNNVNLRVANGISSKNYHWTGFGEISGQRWSCIKHNAKVNNKTFDITIEYVWNLFLEQNRKCIYSGVELYFSKDSKELVKGNWTASLDRIDSSKGYIIDNVQWVHKDLNRMKLDLSTEDFLMWCIKVYNKLDDINFIVPISTKHRNFEGYKEISGMYFCVLNRSAKKRNIDFNITIEDIWDQYEKQNYLCIYTGEPVVFASRYGKSEQTASVDRIDSSKDYTVDNIQIVHKVINKIKGELSSNDFIKLCNTISEHNKC